MSSDGSPKTDWQAERVPVLDSADMRARTDEHGHLELTLPDGRVCTNLRVVPAFPISRPNRFLYFMDEEGNEIGLLVDPKGLDRESLDLLLAQGVVARQQGEMRVHARSEVTLALPEAPEKISTETDLRILFDLRLAEIR